LPSGGDVPRAQKNQAASYFSPYLHGEYFSPTTTDNDFNGFSMYSSKDLATWKNEGMILPQQASGELGPKRKGERPHIIKCPSTGEFVLYAHAASEDYQTDKEVVYATSATVNGKYAYKGPLEDAGGNIAAHSDMTAFSDGNNAYVMTESGHVYTLATDCHSWLTDKTYAAVNGNSGGSESPTVFKAGSTYYWIGSNKTGWRANNNFYSTAPAITRPWTYQGFVAPVTDPNNDLSDQRTWLTQSTWVQPVTGCNGDHWDGNLNTTAPGKHNNLATFVFQPLVFTGTKIGMPTYQASWKINVGAGTWSQ
jgi:Glycosyl hydrolases family 43